MTHLLTDHVRIEPTPEGYVVEPEYVAFMRANGYTIRDVVEMHTVESSSRDGHHLVWLVETYAFPKDSSLLDVADPEHQISVWVCSCEDYRYNQSVDVSEGVDTTPADCGSCQHIKSVSKVAKAEADESQMELL